MTNPLDDLDNDVWVQQLVQYDESLRLGQKKEVAETAAPEVQETADFLLRLQSIWPRTRRQIGPYTLTHSLGQGTLGTTYMVEDPATGQPYVLKVLWPNLNADAAARAQLLQESQAVDALRHADIVGLKEVREAGPVCYVVSEYCKGPSLAQWRRRTPQPLAWEVAVPTVARLADILEVVHRLGITHGNFKPSNIFLPHNEEITSRNLHQATLRIAEFALARAVLQSPLSAHGGLPWPMPHYLAPEQMRHRRRPPEPASDIYALGVLAYELLTGRCPVKGATREEIVGETRRTAPAPLRQFRPELPAALDTLVLQCLQKNPRDRPSSARDLAQALRALLPVPIEQKPAPAWWKQWLGWM